MYCRLSLASMILQCDCHPDPYSLQADSFIYFMWNPLSPKVMMSQKWLFWNYGFYSIIVRNNQEDNGKMAVNRSSKLCSEKFPISFVVVLVQNPKIAVKMALSICVIIIVVHVMCYAFVVLQAPCCNQIYTCRLCHDEKEDHEMVRKNVETIKCLQCGNLQKVGADLW